MYLRLVDTKSNNHFTWVRIPPAPPYLNTRYGADLD